VGKVTGFQQVGAIANIGIAPAFQLKHDLCEGDAAFA
jgi:hypothetical protein